MTVMHANNETGTIQPIARLADIAKAKGDILVHTDAAQTLGPALFDPLSFPVAPVTHGTPGERSLKDTVSCLSHSSPPPSASGAGGGTPGQRAHVR